MACMMAGMVSYVGSEGPVCRDATAPVVVDIGHLLPTVLQLVVCLREHVSRFTGFQKYGCVDSTLPSLVAMVSRELSLCLDAHEGTDGDLHVVREMVAVCDRLRARELTVANRLGVIDAWRDALVRVHAAMVVARVVTEHPAREYQRILSSMQDRRYVYETPIWSAQSPVGMVFSSGWVPARMADIEFAANHVVEIVGDWYVRVEKVDGLDVVVSHGGELRALVDLDEFIVHSGQAFCPWEILAVMERGPDLLVSANEGCCYGVVTPPGGRAVTVAALGPWPSKRELLTRCPEAQTWTHVEAEVEIRGQYVHVLSEGCLPDLPEDVFIGGRTVVHERSSARLHVDVVAAAGSYGVVGPWGEVQAARSPREPDPPAYDARQVDVVGVDMHTAVQDLPWVVDDTGPGGMSAVLKNGSTFHVGPVVGEQPWFLTFGPAERGLGTLRVDGAEYVAEGLVLTVYGRAPIVYEGLPCKVWRKHVSRVLPKAASVQAFLNQLPLITLHGVYDPPEYVLTPMWECNMVGAEQAWLCHTDLQGVATFRVELPERARQGTHVLRVSSATLASVAFSGAVCLPKPNTRPLSSLPSSWLTGGFVVTGWQGSVTVCTTARAEVVVEIVHVPDVYPG